MARKSRVHSVVEAGDHYEMQYLAGLYCRLSDEDGDDIDQNSIGNQQKIGMAYLKEHPDIQLVDVYFDN